MSFTVTTRDRRDEESDEDATECEVCHRADNEHLMLLCDGYFRKRFFAASLNLFYSCDAGYHIGCLTPPLAAVPEDEWFCPLCAPAQAPRLESLTLRRRVIPRTEVAERVRQRLQARLL